MSPHPPSRSPVGEIGSRPIAINFVEPDTETGVPGRTTFQRQGILVALEDGRKMSFPYQGCQVALGGNTGTTFILTLQGSPTGTVWLYVEDRDFAGHLSPDLPESLRQSIRRLSLRVRIRRHKAVLIGSGLVLGFIVLWFGFLWALDKAVDAVPTEWEVKFGQEIVQGLVKAKRCEDPVITGNIDGIARKLQSSLPQDQPYPLQFHAIWDKDENAFALPGGQILVTSGLLAAAESPDEVAGVLGHEIQHVLGRHTFRGLAKDLGMSLVLAVVIGDQGVLSTLATGGKELLGLKYNRGQELEADRVGIKLAHQAGYNPAGLGTFLRRLQEKSQLGRPAERAVAFLSTHPAHEDRLVQIARLTETLPAPPPPDPAVLRSWTEVRKHAGRIPAGLKDAPSTASPVRNNV